MQPLGFRGPNRGLRREKTRPSRADGTAHTKSPLRKRVERTLKRKGKWKAPIKRTPALPPEIKERFEEEKKRKASSAMSAYVTGREASDIHTFWGQGA